MTDTPANWQSMTVEERKQWATENGIEYEVKQKGQQITVKVDSKAMEDVIEDKVKLRADLEDANAKLSLVAERLFQSKKRDLGAPQSISNPQELKDWSESQRHEDPILRNQKTGQGAGQIGLGNQGNQGNNEGKSWEDTESMIFELVQTKNIGTPEERKNAQAILNALWTKQKDAMKSGDLPNKIYEDDLKDGKSLFRRIMDAKDEEIRARLLKEREK